MSEPIDDLETAVEGFLAKEIPTPERIRAYVQKFRLIYPVDDEAAELLARKFEARHGVTMTIGSVLQDRDYEPWLNEARAGIIPYYWQRYRKLLV